MNKVNQWLQIKCNIKFLIKGRLIACRIEESKPKSSLLTVNENYITVRLRKNLVQSLHFLGVQIGKLKQMRQRSHKHLWA